jgi:CheY-like chemotaxis protein
MQHPGILIVDNNPKILDVIERMFRCFRIKVECITSAASAIERLQNAQYRTLIIDIALSDMVGVALAHRAHEIDPELNIMLFVADSPEQILKLILESKVSDISAIPLKSYNFGGMLLDIKYRETGKVSSWNELGLYGLPPDIHTSPRRISGTCDYRNGIVSRIYLRRPQLAGEWPDNFGSGIAA